MKCQLIHLIKTTLCVCLLFGICACSADSNELASASQKPVTATPTPEPVTGGYPIYDPVFFYSEEEFQEALANGKDEKYKGYGLDTLERYYKLQSDPEETKFAFASPGTRGTYGSQMCFYYANGEFTEFWDETITKSIFIIYLRFYHYEIGKDGSSWTKRDKKLEYHIIHNDISIYYIHQVLTSFGTEENPHYGWNVEWYLGDDLLSAMFPYDKYTYKEVAEILGDVVRVDVKR